MRDANPGTIYLKDYAPPDYLIENTELHFDLHEEHTVVTATLHLTRHVSAAPDAPLELHGQELELLSLALDGRELDAAEWRADAEKLVVHSVPEQFALRCVTRIRPQDNTSLEGLYKSRTMFCTQCEAEGFRKITYYLDRPDVMSVFTVSIEADRGAYPVLLSNGNLVEVRDLGDGWLVVHVLVDCRDAMGAHLVNTVAEALSDRVAELAGGRSGLRILSNLSDRRNVRVRCAIPVDALAFGGYSGEDVRDRIVKASEFAERDPYRAATHNKGTMNGVDPVVIATGNDWRAIEAGAHAYAARSGQYAPLCTWRLGDDGALVGFMEIPIALGTVGGTLRVHDGARFGLKVAGVDSAQELAMLAACVGVASNFAALRALATDGIQRGHMALHARSVAIAAGARGGDVERVAAEIHAAGRVTVEAARAVLLRMLGHDDDLGVIEMSIVTRPFVLDFGKVRLDQRLEDVWPDEVLAERWAYWRSLFEDAQWPIVLAIFHELGGRYGIWLEDIHPGNIAFNEAPSDHSL